MSNYNIPFIDIKKISNHLDKGYENTLLEYLNSFLGNNIFEKFQNILKCWEIDVSPTIDFNFGEKPTKIQLAYILSQMDDMSEDIEILEEDIKIIIGIPDRFQSLELIPIYNILKYIEISGISINLSNLSLHDRVQVINNLPPKVYNIIFDKIIKETSKIFTIDNPSLQDFKLNFLSNDVYKFLKGMFSNFDEYYFKDVIFHLSKRIDGQILLQSTPTEIQYYIEKYSSEVDDNNKNLNI
jgi:hypothetical protein